MALHKKLGVICGLVCNVGMICGLVCNVRVICGLCVMWPNV